MKKQYRAPDFELVQTQVFCASSVSYVDAEDQDPDINWDDPI